MRYVGSEADREAVGQAFHRRDVPIGAHVSKSGSSILFGPDACPAKGSDAAFFEELPVERRVTDVKALKVGDLSAARAREILKAVKAVIALEDRGGDVAGIAEIPNPFRPHESKEGLTNLVYVALNSLPEGSTLQFTKAIGAAVLLASSEEKWLGRIDCRGPVGHIVDTQNKLGQS